MEIDAAYKLFNFSNFFHFSNFFARLCPSEGCVNDLEGETLNSEDTNEDGCWTEEGFDTPTGVLWQRCWYDELSHLVV